MRRAVWLLVVLVASVGVLLLFVFPTRTLLDQRREVAHINAQIAALQSENAVLRARAADLQKPATIEKIARQEFGLVLPGQRAYAVIPTPQAPASHPGGAVGHPNQPHGHHPWWELWRYL